MFVWRGMEKESEGRELRGRHGQNVLQAHMKFSGNKNKIL